MSDATQTTASPALQRGDWQGNGIFLPATILGGWFLFALALVLAGIPSLETGALPLPMLALVLGPVAIYLGARALSTRFRAWLLAIDLQFLTAMQGWRVLGGMFVVLMLWDVLPGTFAWPAGLGDVAVGLAAPFVVLYLLHDPGYATSSRFVWFNLAGLFDFVVAVGSGLIASGSIPGFPAGAVTTAPMGQFPLAMIPCFAVPLFTLMHLTALYQVSERRRSGG